MKSIRPKTIMAILLTIAIIGITSGCESENLETISVESAENAVIKQDSECITYELATILPGKAPSDCSIPVIQDFRVNTCAFPLEFYYQSAGAPSSCTEQLIIDCIADWNANSPLPGQDLFVYMGQVSSFAADNGRNEIHWISAGTARVNWYLDPASDNIEFDIRLPDSAGFEVTCNDPSPDDEFCASETLKHELGHVLSLGHTITSPPGESVMVPFAAPFVCTDVGTCDVSVVTGIFDDLVGTEAMNITNLTNTPTFNAGTGTWSVTFDFMTSLAADATVQIQSTSLCAIVPGSEVLAVDNNLVQHSIQMSGLADNTAYVYSVTAQAGSSDSSCLPVQTGSFVLSSSGDVVDLIGTTIKAKTCQVLIAWESVVSSSDNALYYRLADEAIWQSVPALEADCSTQTTYSAAFMAAPYSVFEIRAGSKIMGTTYYSPIETVATQGMSNCLNNN